jgi:hypothetical protein
MSTAHLTSPPAAAPGPDHLVERHLVGTFSGLPRMAAAHQAVKPGATPLQPCAPDLASPNPFTWNGFQRVGDDRVDLDCTSPYRS